MSTTTTTTKHGRAVAQRRAEVAALKAERAALQAAGPSRSEILTGYRARLIEAAETAARRIAHGEQWTWLAAPLSADGKAVDIAATLVLVLGPDRIMAAIEAACPAAPGLNAEQRAARLDDLGVLILTAERDEESAVMAAHAAGDPVHRRADADPRAILAV